MKKTCTKCHKNRDVIHFRKDRQKKDGLYSCCNDCQRKRTGAKKLKHNIIGCIDGYKVTMNKKQLYPTIIGIDGGAKRVHIYVMEKKLGGKIQKGMHVHHINGNKLDWSEANLTILKKELHHSIHSSVLGLLRKNGKMLMCKSCGKEKYYPLSYSHRYDFMYQCMNCYRLSGGAGGRHKLKTKGKLS